MSLQPAVIGIIFNDRNDSIVLVKRCDVPMWVLPGGGIDPQEAAEEAVKREVSEETGFRVEIIRQSAEYHPVNRLASLTRVYVCKVSGGELKLSSETASAAFFPLNALPKPFFHLHANWLQEALRSPVLIRRPLVEVTYGALLRYALRHPWQVIRYAWTRFAISK